VGDIKNLYGIQPIGIRLQALSARVLPLKLLKKLLDSNIDKDPFQPL